MRRLKKQQNTLRLVEEKKNQNTWSFLAANGNRDMLPPQFDRYQIRMKTTFAYIVLAASFASQPSLHAQTSRAPKIQWQVTLGGERAEWPTKIIEGADGSFFVGGTTWSAASGNKTSPLRDSELRSIEPDENGDTWVVKLNRLGVKQWDSSYGGVGADLLVDLAPTKDGGVFVGGTGFRGEVVPLDLPCLEPFCGWAWFFGSKDYFVARTDADGHTLWQQFLGGDNQEALAGLVVGLDNSVTVIGNSLSSPGGGKTAPLFGDYDAWTVRIDSAGNRIWDRSFGGVSADQIGLAQKTSDGGMILCGTSFSDAGGNKSSPAYGGGDVWLLRLNAAGEKLWEQSLGGTSYEAPLKLYEMPDGGFLIGCGSASPISGNKTSPSLDIGQLPGGDFWIVRVNAQGVVIWDKTFGTESWDLMLDFQPTANGGAIFSGVRFADPVTGDLSLPFEFRLIEIDAKGTEHWSKVFDANSTSAVGWLSSRLLALPDQGILIGATSFTDGTNSLKTSPTHGLADCWLLRLDSRGNKLWDLSLGGDGADDLNTLDRSQDGGFVVGIASESSSSVSNGNKTYPGYGLTDMWIVKLGPELPPDSDGDGIPDNHDQCPNTRAGDIVNASGCSIDQLVPCDGPWRNHGQYVSRMAKVCAEFRKAGLISHKQCLRTFLNAVKSDCGKRPAKKVGKQSVRLPVAGKSATNCKACATSLKYDAAATPDHLPSAVRRFR